MKISFTRKPITCFEDESVFKVISKMERNNIKALPIIDKKNRLKGIFSTYRILYDLKNPDPSTKVTSIKHRAASIKEDQDEEEAIRLMAQTGLESIPVMSNGRVIGLISDYDIVNKFKYAPIFQHMLATDLMHKKISIKQNTSIAKAREIMKKNRIDTIPVYDGNSLIGIAVASKLIEKFIGVPRIRQSGKGDRVGNKLKRFSLPVKDLIDKSIKPINEVEPLTKAMSRLVKYNLSSLPVVEQGKVIGTLRRIDIIKFLNKKLTKKDINVNVSGKVDLDQAREIINMIRQRVKSLNYLFKETSEINIHVKKALIKHHYVITIRVDRPNHHFKREGMELFKIVHEMLDKIEDLLEKELKIKKSKRRR